MKRVKIKQIRVTSTIESSISSLNQLTIMNNGEADINTKAQQLSVPTTTCRISVSLICKLPATMIANKLKSASSNPSILICQQYKI